MNNLLRIPTSNELYHHGILGMKWGIRRYQPYPKGKKKGKEVGEAAEKPKETRAQYEKRKETALKSGSAKDIVEFKGDLTNQQMETAIKRLDLEKKLTSYAYPPEKTSQQKIDEMMKSAKKMNEWTNIGIDVYNTFARIYNTKDVKKKMKLVGGKPGGGKGGNKK